MRSKKLLGLLLLLVVTVGMAVPGVRWIHFRLTHAVTNAVFVESDTFLRVAFKRVSGRIEKLYKSEGDKVSKGEPLAKLDDRDLRIKLEELKNQIRRLEREREALIVKRRTLEREIEKRIEIANVKIEEIRRNIEALDIRIGQLKRDRDRFEKLYSKGVVPSRKFEELDTELRTLKKKRESLREALKSAKLEIKILEIRKRGLREMDLRVKAIESRIGALKKKIEDVKNLISETLLRSPIDGYVVKRYVSTGEVVRQGQSVYAIYDPKDIYILVLLEETKLEGVKEGNRVLINIDAYPGERFEGIVKSINRATAAKFALIPRDVTAGEFTKVAQRIPVKVEITRGRKELLRIGMGGEVAIEKTR